MTDTDADQALWPPSGTPLADLLELMVLKAITGCYIDADGDASYRHTGMFQPPTAPRLSFHELLAGSVPDDTIFLLTLGGGSLDKSAYLDSYERTFAFTVKVDFTAHTIHVIG